ncbi:hypothetical protein, partial [Streptomyces sp. NPDC056405]
MGLPPSVELDKSRLTRNASSIPDAAQDGSEAAEMHHTTDALLAPAELIPPELPPAARTFAARKNGCAVRGMSRRATGPAAPALVRRVRAGSAPMNTASTTPSRGGVRRSGAVP